MKLLPTVISNWADETHWQLAVDSQAIQYSIYTYVLNKRHLWDLFEVLGFNPTTLSEVLELTYPPSNLSPPLLIGCEIFFEDQNFGNIF